MSGLRDHLQSIYHARGRLTPVDVLDEARDDAHPLHGRFEWDDAVAGEKYRLVQAHELIRSVKVRYVSGDETRDVRGFQAVRSDDGFRYEPVEQVVQDEVLTQLVLREMERDWRQLRARYQHFDEFRQLVAGDLQMEVA